MRNRTEMVSNTGSDYDENEAEFEGDGDSDDWKPEPEVSNALNEVNEAVELLWMCLCEMAA